MKTLIVSIILVFNVINAFSQNPCGFDSVHRRLLKTNSQYKKAFAESENKIKALLADKEFSKVHAPVYRIPVVVHVFHNGEMEGTGSNISDQQIQSAITALSDHFRGTLGSGADAEIEFELANLAPDCSPTTGIVRVDASAITNYSTMGLTLQSSGGNEVAIKNLSRWPQNHYYNIWVVSEIEDNNGSGGIQGFAYFPGAPPTLDGTVVLASSFGYDPGGANGFLLKSYTNLNTTITHEMGHALGLYHTFEGQLDVNNDLVYECPVNANCNVDGDDVCDTDPQVQTNSNCPGGTNTCSGNPNSNIVHNYMDYSSELCKTNFTSGQVARMRAYLVGARPALTSSHALNTTSPLSPYVPPVPATTTPATLNFGFGYAGIYNISLNQRYRPSGNADGDAGYVNGTTSCLNLVQLFRGTTYTLAITILGLNNEQLGAWIDYNNDGDFVDAGEQILYAANIAGVPGGGQIVSVNFTVPGTAPLSTAVRLRVMDDLSTVYGGGITPIASNTNSQYGQGEDYPVYFSSLLPIVLSDFSGELKDDHASLQWSTSEVRNGKGFEIERSYDGKDFSRVGYLPVVEGNSTQPGKYVFNDPDLARENNYYRLKQYDIDNKFQYSKVVFIKSAKASTAGFTIINNPFNSFIDVSLQNIPKGKVDIRLLSITGQEIFRKAEFPGTGAKIRIDLSGKTLLKGIYFLEITTNGETEIQKVVRQ